MTDDDTTDEPTPRVIYCELVGLQITIPALKMRCSACQHEYAIDGRNPQNMQAIRVVGGGGEAHGKCPKCQTPNILRLSKLAGLNGSNGRGAFTAAQRRRQRP